MDRVFQYRIKEDKWEDLRITMSQPRIVHACLLLDQNVIVVGGVGGIGSRTYKSTEILDIQTKQWRPGPDLPEPIGGGRLVRALPGSKYEAYLIGGETNRGTYSDSIYGLTKNLGKFDEIGVLKRKRSDHVALVLPNEVIEKCI